MNIINFDPAKGILQKSNTIYESNLPIEQTSMQVKNILHKIFSHDTKDILLGTNESTVLNHVLSELNIKDATLIATDHEYLGIVKMLEGQDVSNYVTRPSSNLKIGVPNPKRFIINKVIIEYQNEDEFKKLLDTEIKNCKNKTILILMSHVSRITGEQFPIESIYKYITKSKYDNKKIYVIIDGAQSVFVQNVIPKTCSNIYLGTSSKALGAEPTIGFAFINNIKPISTTKMESKKSLNSFYHTLKNFYLTESQIHTRCEKIDIKVSEILKNLGYDFVAPKYNTNILSVEEPNADKIEEFLIEHGIHISNSANNRWTLCKFNPRIRISWRENITKNDLNMLAITLAEAKSLAKLDSKIIHKKLNDKGILFIDAGKSTGSIYGQSKPLAISILQTIAEKNDIISSFISLDELPKNDALNILKQKCKELSIIAITSSSPGHAKIIKLFENLQKNGVLNEVIVLKGSIHETISATDLQKDYTYPIDFSFLGESDVSFDKFLKLLKSRTNKNYFALTQDIEKIEGIQHKSHDFVAKKQYISPELFVLPKYKFLRTEKPYSLFSNRENQSMLRVMTMRGCAFGCAFCAIVKNCRRISPLETVKYIKTLITDAKDDGVIIKQLFFEDATFTIEEKLNLHNMEKWAHNFAQLLKKENIKLEFGIQTRQDCLNEDIIKTLSAAGLKTIYIGVESINNNQLSEFNKGYSLEDKLIELMKKIGQLKSHRVNISTSLIFIPGFEDEILSTIEFLSKLEIDELFLETYKIFPATLNALKYDEKEIIQYYNKGLTKVKSPNLDDLECVLLDPNHKKLLTKIDCHQPYNEISEFIRTKTKYIEITAGHYILPKYLSEQ
jgi:radical SAM superfamily enzyme YgiQ (UPF0313 family)